MKILPSLFAAATLLLPTTAAFAANHSDPATRRAQINHGRYLIKITSCNDCHTPGWGQSGGHVAEKLWLTGTGEVFVGPWGTSYPVNLRLLIGKLSLKQWIHTARTTKGRPPMPWYSLRDMTDTDLAAVYYFVRSLEPAGKPAHAALPPGEMPPAPYMQLVLPAKPVASK